MKRLTILTTGGTIAMTANTAGSADLIDGAATLGGAAAKLTELAKIDSCEVLNLPSASLALPDLARLVQAVHAADGADGVVVTHGTDTLEEIAFALELLLRQETPVVLTGAMRRADQLGADGPANLLAAAMTALDHRSRGRGVLVVFDQEIHWAPLVRKVHAFRTHAFSSTPFGPVGWVREERVRYALKPDLAFPRLQLGDRQAVVPILEVGAGLEPAVVEVVSQVGDALVVSLPGGGHVSARSVGALAALAERKPVVFASRTGGGGTLSTSYAYAGSETDLLARGLIAAGALNARQARMLLLVLLSMDLSMAEVVKRFEALP